MNTSYKNITDEHRKKMNGICNNSWTFNWEKPWLIDILTGDLPKIRENRNDEKIYKELFDLEELFKNYDSCSSDKKKFLSTAIPC